MKHLLYSTSSALLLCGLGFSQETVSYVNYIRQYQMPGGVTWDAQNNVPPDGTMSSALEINPGGARFELVTIKSSSLTGLTEYPPLASCYVGTYVPLATVMIRSEDTTGDIPRTRADRPFSVDITISALLSGDEVPEASKSVNYYEHVQSYGVGRTGIGIDRTQATLLNQSSITANGTVNRTFDVNLVPGADRSKVRGEQRFSVFSLDDTRGTYHVDPQPLASQSIQIWPVADGSISGISNGQLIRFQFPQVTLTLKDLYPFSTTYAQVYKGKPQLGTTGNSVTGSASIVNESVPIDKTLVLSTKDMDEAITEDGIWTLELITVTPFGVERLRDPAGNVAAVWFEVDRNIDMNGTFTTIE